MKITLRKSSIEKGFVVVAFLLFTNAFVSLLAQPTVDGTDAADGNAITQAIFSGVYIVTFVLMVRHWKKVVWAVTKEKFLLILVALALASVLWSVAPLVTLRRSIALVGTTAFGVYLATRYSLNEQLRLLAWTSGIAALLSILFALALPSFGVHQGVLHTGAWKGIYVHKNALGRSMGLSFVVFSLFVFFGGKYRWVAWVGLGLSVILMRLSTSATPLFSSLTILLLLPLYRVLQWQHPLAMFLFTSAVMGGVSLTTVLAFNAETILGAFGRDLTLTGRTDLWFVLVEMIQKRPWLGYGYSGFWAGWEGPSAFVWQIILWKPQYAHNGYLELGLALGLVGLSVFVLGFLLSFLRALIWARATKSVEGLFPLAFLTFMLPYNVSDSVVLQQNNIFWILYVSTVLSMIVKHNRASSTIYNSETLSKGEP